MNWVEAVVSEHSEFESPLNFWRWAAIAAISAVVKDNVWFARDKIYKAYPNIYVLFHADSGLKKGPPISMARKLVAKVGGTKIYYGRSSIQGILKDLGTAKSAPGGKIEKSNSAFICASELSASIVEDPAATTLLTDLYDRNYNEGQWKSLLKSEVFGLNNATITWLAATNEAHSDDFFSRKDIKGGLFARTFIIHEKEENRSNSLIIPSDHEIDYDKYAEYLKTLSQLNGPFAPLGSKTESDYHNLKIINPVTGSPAYVNEAGKLYIDWYHELKKSTKGVKDPTGALNRFGDSVLKVAMLLSLAEKPELFITYTGLQTAIEYCEKLIGNIRQVTMGKTEAEGTNANRKVLLLQELLNRENHTITQTQLYRKYWVQGSSEEWADAIKSFVDAGIISTGMIGNQPIITLKLDAAEEIRNFLNGKGHR